MGSTITCSSMQRDRPCAPGARAERAMATTVDALQLAAGASVRLLAPAACKAPLMGALRAAANGTAAAGLLTLTRPRCDMLPSFGQLASQAQQLARALPPCAAPPLTRRRSSASAERDVGASASDAVEEQAQTGLELALSTVARAKAKVSSALSVKLAERLKTRFLFLIILFIKEVVIPNFLCPPVTDGLAMIVGPTIAYNLVAPLVQGTIEKGAPKTVNLLGGVIGVFLGLILFMRLLVQLTICLGDGIVFVISNRLNREIARVVTNFVNVHIMTAEMFMILHETTHRVTGNVINRLGLSLTHALTHSVTHTVTHKILHHYYCIYCYYYGNFCDFCYRYDELTYMHRLWGFGQGKSEDCGSPRQTADSLAKPDNTKLINSIKGGVPVVKKKG